MKLLLKAVTLLLVLSLLGCANGAGETTGPAPTETEAPPETTQLTEPTEPATEPVTEPTEPPVLFHSGLREDGTFTEGTWFIGDSMTCILVEDYLKPQGLIGDAYYTGRYGAHITAFFDGTIMTHTGYNPCAFRPEHNNCTYDAVAFMLGDKVEAIYLMFGTNYTWNAYADAYIELVDFLLQTCPNATIHLQTIPMGNPGVVKYDTVNGWILEAYEHYARQGQDRVFLLDVFTAIGDVRDNRDSGGIHLSQQGNELWYNAIKGHAEANGLVP